MGASGWASEEPRHPRARVSGKDRQANREGRASDASAAALASGLPSAPADRLPAAALPLLHVRGQGRDLRLPACPAAPQLSFFLMGSDSVRKGPTFRTSVFNEERPVDVCWGPVPTMNPPRGCFLLGGRAVGLPLRQSTRGGGHGPLTLALLLSSRLHPGVEQELRAVRLLWALRHHRAAGKRHVAGVSPSLWLEQSFWRKGIREDSGSLPSQPSVCLPGTPFLF